MSLFYNHTLLPPLTTASHPHHHLPPPMRGVSKFSLLLATPVSLLHHRRCTSLLRLTRTISISPLFPTPPQSLLLPIKASSKGFHSQTNYSSVDDHFGGSFTPPSSHPLPEWSKLVEAVSALGYLDYSRGFNNPEDEFVSYDGLPEQFVRDAAACLTFARERPDILGLLSRRHIEILVQNGAPFLFKCALDTERRLRSFLGSSGSSYVMESDKAATVDLLKYIVSFASNPTSTGRNNSSNMELTESSVRFLLNELVDMSCRAKDSDVNAPDQYQHSGSYGQTSRFLGPKIEMKRGDWICSKCSFMNFARNLKCLECEGPRPKRQLTGGEWECPQCDFLNYGRNMACLRCDCKRSGEAVLGSPNSISASGYNNGGYANNYSADGSSQNQSISGNSATNGSSPHSRTSPQYGNQRGNNSGYTPFVPLPPDMFAKKNQESTSEDGKEPGTKISDQVYSTVHDQTSIVDKSVRLVERVQLSDKPSTEAIKHSEEKEQEEKSERWFKRVAELHDVPDLASAVSDEDFPDIMPMRKGENRFVISKNKDRSLTSPAYKRQNPIEQGTNAQFVPFVPFPPDYFAKKDKQQPESKDSTVGPTGETSLENSTFKKSGTETLGMNNMSGNSNLNSNPSSNSFGSQINSSNSWNTSMGPTSSRISNSGGNPSQPQESQNLRNGWTGKSLEGSAVKNSSNGWNTSVGPTSSQISNSGRNPSQPQESQNLQSGWTGKSLEGSAVTEPDPLDMSEEAKAERWFRRVAQIKDISELSQIPDEDFPSIMPMRKGVNRFVVSKRKTPLERRLTSPQYRKNLPVMNSDPRKNENDNN